MAHYLVMHNFYNVLQSDPFSRIFTRADEIFCWLLSFRNVWSGPPFETLENFYLLEKTVG